MKRLGISLCILIFLIALVNAAPPVTTTQQFAEGFVIEDTPQLYFQQDLHYQYNFFVYNLSNGLLVTNSSITCYNYIAGKDGEIMSYQQATYTVADGHWTVEIDKGNFSEVGLIYYGTKCQDANFGGTQVGTWEITPTGILNSVSYYIIILLLSLGLIVFGLSIKDAPITIFGSFGLYFVGIYILFFGIVGVKDPIYTWAIGVITLGIAFYVSTRSAYELISGAEIDLS